MTAAPGSAAGTAEPLTIDELARQVALPVRTIREYHTMRLLPPPERRGRVGLYGPRHVQRLQLITRLQRRGYSLAGIRDLLGAWESGTDLTTLLGVGQGQAVLDEAPLRLTRAELLQRLPALQDAAVLEGARQAGLVRPHGGEQVIVRSPALLALAADWVQAGVPLADALGVIEVLTGDLGALARTLAGLIADRVWAPAAAGAADLPGLLRRGRPLLLQGVASTLVDRLGAALAERAEASGDGRLLAALEGARVGAVTDSAGTIHRRGSERGGPGMNIVNTDQAEHWNTGDGVAHWVRNQDRYDRMNAPFAAMILDAAGLRPGTDVLDVGCGCGGTTLAAARLAAPGQAVGLDLSGPMLARARSGAAAAGLGNAEFRQGDAQVHPLEPGRFGTVLSRFGVMFFADPVAAFANIRSAARPEGRLAFVCWQPLAANEWLLVPRAALAEHVPPGGFGSGDGPGMFAFADPDRIRQVLAGAGWRDVKVTAEQASILVGGGGSVDEAVEFLRTGTMGRTMLAGAAPETADRALASVRDALARHADAEGVHLGAAVWLVQAAAS